MKGLGKKGHTRMVALFAAQAGIMTSRPGSEEGKGSAAQRNKILGKLTPAQRTAMTMVCRVLDDLVSRKPAVG